MKQNQNSALHDCRYVARCTIEFTTPFIIGRGREDLFTDSHFVADANGLPAIPGSSIAGVLRHELETRGWNEDRIDQLFGYQNKDEGCGSRLTVSWACIHDCENRPVEGLRAPLDQDPVLNQAKMIAIRDHVRINHRGAAADHGKFDEACISAGHRFSFELILEGAKEEEEQKDWDELLDLLGYGGMRFGGKTRRGYGRFKVVTLKQGVFNLATQEGLHSFLNLPPSLADGSEGFLSTRSHSESDNNPGEGQVCISMEIKPRMFWFVGGGAGSEADMTPMQARKIIWNDQRGEVGNFQYVLPATSIKGALAHRTAFHYNALCGNMIQVSDGGDRLTMGDNEELDEVLLLDHCGEKNHAVGELFGFCKDDQHEGQRGRVLIDDIFIETPGIMKKINHVSIDPFTGGAIDGALFDEYAMYGSGDIALQIIIKEPKALKDPKGHVKMAFARAIQDFAEGRLGIGSGVNRGNGFFELKEGTSINWSQDDSWLKSEV